MRTHKSRKSRLRGWPGSLGRWFSTRPRLSQAISVASVVVALLVVLAVARITGAIDSRLWNALEPRLVEGARNTAIYSLTIIPVGLMFGFLIGWARFSRYPILSWPATVYVDFVRGVPPMVMVLFAYFWLPTLLGEAGVETGLALAVLALAIHTSAYQAEIFRAGFQSVARGQVEAGQAIGLSGGQVMGTVVLPQTFRVTLPALGNEFALVIKDSSILSAISALDLVYWGRNAEQFAIAVGGVEWVTITWLVIALIYFVITFLVTQTVLAVERSFRVPGLGSVAF